MPRHPGCALLVLDQCGFSHSHSLSKRASGECYNVAATIRWLLFFTSSEIQDTERVELADLPKPNTRIRRCLIEVKETPWASPSSPLILAALRSASQPGHPAFG